MEEEEMTKLGERLIKSAGESRAIAEGKMAAKEIEVACIRKRLNLSQGKFAERFHLSTIRDRQQKRRNPPDRIAVNLLRAMPEFG
jgi:putative transcriptional regulator